ncbi:MAG: creatininase family protein [Candidatus Altiarchaeota archaeon]|nr:creatininase family protein [Candidatus Altiarchaeota archaeon]
MIPVGSFEQHGPHLAFETDTIIAEAVAREVASRTGSKVGATVPVGVSVEHMDFPGTKTLSPEEFKKRIKEIADASKDAVFINGHGGNNRSLRELGVRHVNLTTLFKPYDHAGEIESSIIMHLKPELVKKDKIRKHDFRWPDKDGWKTIDYSRSGVLGDPTKATEEKGVEYFNTLVEKTIELLK